MTQCQANFPDESIIPLSSSVKTGVYYGYAQVIPPKDVKSEWPAEDLGVLPMAMSLGWNPFYKNERLTAVCSSSTVPYSTDAVTGNSHHAWISFRFLWL